MVSNPYVEAMNGHLEGGQLRLGTYDHHPYKPCTNWDDPPSRLWLKNFDLPPYCQAQSRGEDEPILRGIFVKGVDTPTKSILHGDRTERYLNCWDNGGTMLILYLSFVNLC